MRSGSRLVSYAGTCDGYRIITFIDMVIFQMHSKIIAKDEGVDAVTFPTFWRWWVSEAMYEFISTRKQQ